MQSSPSARIEGRYLGRWGIAFSFLTSALIGGEWPASFPSRFIPCVKNPRRPLNMRLCGTQSRS